MFIIRVSFTFPGKIVMIKPHRRAIVKKEGPLYHIKHGIVSAFPRHTRPIIARSSRGRSYVLFEQNFKLDENQPTVYGVRHQGRNGDPSQIRLFYGKQSLDAWNRMQDEIQADLDDVSCNLDDELAYFRGAAKRGEYEIVMRSMGLLESMLKNTPSHIRALLECSKGSLRAHAHHAMRRAPDHYLHQAEYMGVHFGMPDATRDFCKKALSYAVATDQEDKMLEVGKNIERLVAAAEKQEKKRNSKR